MKQGLFTLSVNMRLAENVYKMILNGDTSAMTVPGQFVNIKLDGLYLRRPISVRDWQDRRFSIVYKVVGAGTRQMSEMKTGSQLDVLTGLGNGYDMSASGARPVLIGGGAGIPPLYGLAKRLLEQGKKPLVVLGFNTKSEVFMAKGGFDGLPAETIITTVDGSEGMKGLVTDAVAACADYTYFYACGPEPMLRAVYEATGDVDGEFSFEARMGCGFGACMGCSCETKYGTKRICRDGPVLKKGEIIW